MTMKTLGIEMVDKEAKMKAFIERVFVIYLGDHKHVKNTSSPVLMFQVCISYLITMIIIMYADNGVKTLLF